MAKISTYPNDSNITAGDQLIGTDSNDMNATKNFTVGSLAAFMDTNSTVTLQQVLDNNNTATQDINLTGNIDLVDLSISGVLNDFLGNPGTTSQILTSTGTGVKWENQFFNYYGSFYSTVVQVAPAPAVAFTYNNTDFSSGVSIVSGSKIKIANEGKYNIQFSAQLHDTSGGSSKIDIWFRKNGVDIPNSNTKMVVDSNQNQVAAWNFFVDAVANDEYEIMWSTTDLDLIIDYSPATVVTPATPSVILTVNRIG
jgi:hypothetical protein